MIYYYSIINLFICKINIISSEILWTPL